MTLHEARRGLLDDVATQMAVGLLHGPGDKGHEQGVCLDEEGFVDFIFFRVGRCCTGGADGALRRPDGGVDLARANRELYPAGDAGGAVGAAADAIGAGLEEGGIRDLLGEARGEGDEFVDLKAGNVGVGEEELVVPNLGDAFVGLVVAGEGTQVADDRADGLEVRNHDVRGEELGDGHGNRVLALYPHRRIGWRIAGTVQRQRGLTAAGNWLLGVGFDWAVGAGFSLWCFGSQMCGRLRSRHSWAT